MKNWVLFKFGSFISRAEVCHRYSGNPLPFSRVVDNMLYMVPWCGTQESLQDIGRAYCSLHYLDSVICTAHQLYRITLPILLFCLTAGGNLCQRQLKPIDNTVCEGSLTTHWQSFMVDSYIVWYWSAFSRQCWFPQLLQRLCVAFHCELSLHPNRHLKYECIYIWAIMPIKIRPVTIEIIVRFSRYWDSSERNVENY